ncbi:hypothetical protein VVMO6_00309 [Vibrio vulnificus MO6-24/O]|nr:hypothetical protein VVMO6_00309 [Vibrio vulnificus MO6-24/O]
MREVGRECQLQEEKWHEAIEEWEWYWMGSETKRAGVSRQLFYV